jgi:hypothetical protein
MIYQLEVEVPYGDGEEEATEIIPQLSGLAIIYGGSINLNFERLIQANTNVIFRRQIVNLDDANGTLGDRIDTLRRRFPHAVFHLKEQELQ